MIYEYKDLKIDVLVDYKPKNRNTYLRIKDGKLIISTPKRLTDALIKNYIETNYQFLKKHLEKKREVTNNHQIHLFGKPYDFKIVESKENRCYLENDLLIIATTHNTYRSLKILVEHFYASYLNDFLINHYESIYELYKDIIALKPSYEIKNYTSCFAKYVSASHQIIFSTMLAKYDPFYIKLVIAHELTHVLERNHQASFYKLFESRFPNAKKHQHNLRKIRYNDYF